MVSSDEKLYHVSKDKGIVGKVLPKSSRYKMPYAIDAAYQTNFGRAGDPLFDVIFTGDVYYIYRGFSRMSGPHTFIGGNYNKANFCRVKNRRDRRPVKINFPPSVRKIDAVFK